MHSVVTTQNLRKRLPTKKGFYEAVRGIDIEVSAQEIFGFLGPNGAGKTTTIRMLTTLLPIDEGEAWVAGFNVKTEARKVRTKIGYVSQQGGTDRAVTGREDLMLQGGLYGMTRAATTKAANELIELFSLGECIDRLVASYSGGQRRRLDIALGMVHKPKIMFLDEPTTGLDPQNRANLWEQLRALKKEGVAIFLTSHYLDEVDYLADHLAIIDQGKIVAVGSPSELKRQISGDIITIGAPPEDLEQAMHILQQQNSVKEVSRDNQHLRLAIEHGATALPKLLRLLDKAKITVTTSAISTPTLDDVFLKQTGHALRE